MTLAGHGSVARCLSVGCTLVTRHPFFKSEKGLRKRHSKAGLGTNRSHRYRNGLQPVQDEFRWKSPGIMKYPTVLTQALFPGK